MSQKNKIKLKDRDVVDILDVARELLLKRIQQAVRKAERAVETEAPN